MYSSRSIHQFMNTNIFFILSPTRLCGRIRSWSCRQLNISRIIGQTVVVFYWVLQVLVYFLFIYISPSVSNLLFGSDLHLSLTFWASIKQQLYLCFSSLLHTGRNTMCSAIPSRQSLPNYGEYMCNYLITESLKKGKEY